MTDFEIYIQNSTFSDFDNQTLTWNITFDGHTLPDWISFENNTFIGFSQEVGDYNICITVEDPYAAIAQSCFIL